MNSTFFDQVYRLVRLIPPGRVATYGQIARLLGVPRGARTVGWAMGSAPEGSGVPWQRVVNARGMVSTDWGGQGSGLQRRLLEAEGVVFDDAGRIDLAVYGWDGPDLGELAALRDTQPGP